jgi:hypothetical protein
LIRKRISVWLRISGASWRYMATLPPSRVPSASNTARADRPRHAAPGLPASAPAVQPQHRQTGKHRHMHQQDRAEQRQTSVKLVCITLRTMLLSITMP